MRVGDTAVVCGVRAEILLVRDIADYRQQERDTSHDDSSSEEDRERRRKKQKRREDVEEMARLNLLVPNLELATGCSPAHLPGGPPSPLAQTLTQRIVTLLHTSHLLDMDDLRIWHHNPPSPASEEIDKMDTSSPSDLELDPSDPAQGKGPELKAFWTLYMDMVFISLDGSPFDAAWGSVLAALRDVRLPRAYWDEDRDCVLCDPDVAVARPLTLQALPVATSFGVFTAAAASEDGGTATANGITARRKKWVLLDMDGFEEGLCAEGGTVVVDMGSEKGQLIKFEKSGGADVGMPEMKEMLKMAGKRWSEWRDVLDKAR